LGHPRTVNLDNNIILYNAGSLSGPSFSYGLDENRIISGDDESESSLVPVYHDYSGRLAGSGDADAGRRRRN